MKTYPPRDYFAEACDRAWSYLRDSDLTVEMIKGCGVALVIVLFVRCIVGV